MWRERLECVARRSTSSSCVPCLTTLYSERANGLPFSCRKRITTTAKMPMISRAKRSAATACSAARLAVPDWHRHDQTTPARNHAGTTGVRRNHTQHRITVSTTSVQQNGPSSHTCTTGTGTPKLGTTGAHERDRPIHRNWIADHAATAAERQSSAAASAPHRMTSTSHRSRARSGRLQRVLGRDLIR
jgi:hypothetical protein